MPSNDTNTAPLAHVGSTAELGGRTCEQGCNGCDDCTDYDDHDEVRCAAMEECDHDYRLAGEPRTCCVCIGHGCAEALAEIARSHGKPADDSKQPNATMTAAPRAVD